MRKAKRIWRYKGYFVFDVERLLKKYRPGGFLLENVRGLTTHDKGRTFETIINSLNSLGYKVEYRLLNSSNFNVAQNRVRIYIVGILEEDFKIKVQSDAGAVDSHNLFKGMVNKVFLKMSVILRL
jgi:DNA (cytosine-5)-methyltransferase 1